MTALKNSCHFKFYMRKLLKVLIVIFIFVISISGGQSEGDKAYAYDADGILVDIDLNGGDKGEFKCGDNVSIKIKLNDVKDLFAASFDYTYDSTLLQVDSIDVDEEIESNGVYQPYKDTAKDGNRARYCFTFLGDSKGLSGDYNFVTINGKAKKDGNINVGPENITFQLIQRKDDDMVKDDYHFEDSKGNIYKVTNGTNNTDENTGKSATDGKVKKNSSDVNIELVKKSEDNEEGKYDNENVSNHQEDEDKQEQDEESHNNTSEESKASHGNEDDENDDEVNNSENSHEEGIDNKSNSFYIAGAIAAILVVAAFAILLNKIKKHKTN